MNLYDKYYFELYALISLQLCYNPAWRSLKHRDRPDLQSDSLGIGIEVTQALTREEGQILAIVNESFGKGLSAEQSLTEINDKFLEKGLPIRVQVEEGVFYVPKLSDVAAILKKINTCVLEKTERLNKGYGIFARNHLYIFGGTSMIRHDALLASLKTLFLPDSYPTRYDLYFINCFDRLSVFNPVSGELSQIPITDPNLFEIHRKALALREVFPGKGREHPKP